MPSKVITIVIELMLLGIELWTLLRAHFNPPLTALAKMSLSGAQNIYDRKHKLCCFIILIGIIDWKFHFLYNHMKTELLVLTFFF